VKRLLASALCAAVAACSTLHPAPAYSQDGTVSLDDVVLLAQSDISDQTILTYLKHRRLDFVLDAEGVQELREAGVSEEIIRYLLELSDTPPAALLTYVTPTGYDTGYPSYYYGARLVGTSIFSRQWYDHHYLEFAHVTAHHAPHHNQGHSLGHTVGITVGHHTRTHIGHGGGIVDRHGSAQLRHSGGDQRSHRNAHSRGHSGARGRSHGPGH